MHFSPVRDRSSIQNLEIDETAITDINQIDITDTGKKNSFEDIINILLGISWNFVHN